MGLIYLVTSTVCSNWADLGEIDQEVIIMNFLSGTTHIYGGHL